MIRRPPRSTLFPLHDALPISVKSTPEINCGANCSASYPSGTAVTLTTNPATGSTFTGWSGGGCTGTRSEEHTSELQSQSNLVCRLLLEKKNIQHSSIACCSV